MANYLSLLTFAYIAAVSIYIVTENRRPQSTFAWMFLFVTLPFIGLAIYILFGRERKAFSRKRKLVRQDLPGHLSQTLSWMQTQHDRAVARLAGETGPATKLATLMYANGHSLITSENRLRVLQNAQETYPALIEDLRAACSSIHLQYYSWGSGSLGEELKALLLAKVAEGVEVRLLYDPVGSFSMLRWGYVREMRQGGIDMRPFSSLWRLHTISYRNHRKIVVIDGAIGYTGGLNIGKEHLDPGHGFELWRDTHLRVVGAAALALQATFAVDWTNATAEEGLLEECYFPPVPKRAADADLPVQIVLSGPDSRWQAIRQLYFAMIVGAERCVYLQSPFFVLDATIAEALKSAALAGVDVRIMVSERGMNQSLPYWAANTYAEEVADAGAKVFLYEPGYLHAKTIVVDSRICSIGSANWDIRSFSINYELNALIYDADVAGQVEHAFERDLARCRPFDLDSYQNCPWAVRFRDSVARLASPLI